MFDLSKTQALENLFAMPRESRDANWTAAFYAAAPEASLATREQQVFTGPDGFRYFALYLPEPNKEFDSFCIAHILEPCLKNGLGCVLNPDKPQPDWVFTYGNLWSLHSYQTFDASPKFVERRAPLGPGREVLMAAPSEQFLPPFARNILKKYLQHLGVADPRVLLINDPRTTPNQSLAFSFHPKDVASQEVFDDTMKRLRDWFLPTHYGLVSLPENNEYESYFIML
jgi:hypothetical protein